MNPQRSLYGRVTINNKRTDLGFTTLNNIFLRAAQTYAGTRTSGEVSIILEVSGAKLPDSSILSREQVLEQSLAASIITDPDEESPFEGITIARVHEVMESLEYQQYYRVCQPDNRLGLPDAYINRMRDNYRYTFPDCFDHFPKWIDS